MGATISFTWFDQSVSAMNRAKQEEKSLLLKIEAFEYIRNINPLKQPQGSMRLKDSTLKWVGRPIRPLQRALNAKGGQGSYEIGLYSVDVEVLDKDSDSKIIEFNIELTGFNKISETGNGVIW